MPAGDRTGPMGAGPMTGRAAGFCSGSGVPGYMNPVGGRLGLGRGFGFGRGVGFGGRGRGWRHWFYATGIPGWARGFGGRWLGWGAPAGAAVSEKDELELLKQQAEQFRSALDSVNSRISELEKSES